MPKLDKKVTKSKSYASSIKRHKYTRATRLYNEFARNFSSTMIIPHSKTIQYFEAILTLSRSNDDIKFCRVCKCFFRPNKDDPRHEDDYCDMSIRDMMAQYKICTKEEMQNAINCFYNNFDTTYILENGWK